MPPGRNIRANHEFTYIQLPAPVEVGNRLFDLSLGDLLLQLVQKTVSSGELDEMRGSGGEADRVADMITPQP